jgi:hypothetical protein
MVVASEETVFLGSFFIARLGLGLGCRLLGRFGAAGEERHAV